jgi:hypothetical protein
MLQLQKVLQVKTHLRALLENSRLRMTREFGADNKALQHVSCAFFYVLLVLSVSVFFRG